jgi:hypothetical protein
MCRCVVTECKDQPKVCKITPRRLEPLYNLPWNHREVPETSAAAALDCAGSSAAAQLLAQPAVHGSYSMAAAGEAQAVAASMAAGTRLKKKLTARPAVRRVIDALCAVMSACKDIRMVSQGASISRAE